MPDKNGISAGYMMLVIMILLPVSVLYNTFFYICNFIVFHLPRSPRKHAQRVRYVQSQVRQWKTSHSEKLMCTSRPGWQTMSFRQGRYKKTHYTIDVNLNHILNVDTNNLTVSVEPQVTMGQITAMLLPLGWTLPIVPELDDLTVGGLIMGTGIESSSHKYGLFQHICVSYEIVLADASVVKCNAEDNADLFYAIPWSYGTLGFLVSAEIRIVPASKYVRLKYKSVYSFKELATEFQKEVEKKSENDFVEGIVYGENESVIMTGCLTNVANCQQIFNLGNFWSPWFFEHVKEIMRQDRSLEKTEFIPIRHYYHRHTRSIFWELQDIIPFGNHPLFRYLLGWAVPPKVSLLKLGQTEAVKKLYEEHHMIQDMLVPFSTLEQSLKMFHKEVAIYPLWLCPFVLPQQPGMVHPAINNNKELFVDIGIYGCPKQKDFNNQKTTRILEQYVRQVKGFQMLYADTYMTREEFKEMFDHELYDKVRVMLNAKSAFPEIYDKISKDARY